MNPFFKLRFEIQVLGLLKKTLESCSLDLASFNARLRSTVRDSASVSPSSSRSSSLLVAPSQSSPQDLIMEARSVLLWKWSLWRNFVRIQRSLPSLVSYFSSRLQKKLLSHQFVDNHIKNRLTNFYKSSLLTWRSLSPCRKILLLTTIMMDS